MASMTQYMIIPAGPYQLRKRFRHEEEHFDKTVRPWTKRVLDLEARTMLGHSLFGWLRLIVFYIFFYIFLVVITVSIYFIFYATMPQQQPRWLLEQPRLSYAPCVRKDNERSIIYYENLMPDIEQYTHQIEKFLGKYGNRLPEYFKSCNLDDVYGYRTRCPCIFIKINQVYNFRAKTYEDAKSLPPDAPEQLYDYILELAADKRKNRIWISCTVEGAQVPPKFTYYPKPYFDAEDIYEPGIGTAYANDADDFKRIVGVMLRNMGVNDDMQFTCNVWAKNIKIDYTISGYGHIRFAMRINRETTRKMQTEEEED